MSPGAICLGRGTGRRASGSLGPAPGPRTTAPAVVRPWEMRVGWGRPALVDRAGINSGVGKAGTRLHRPLGRRAGLETCPTAVLSQARVALGATLRRGVGVKGRRYRKALRYAALERHFRKRDMSPGVATRHARVRAPRRGRSTREMRVGWGCPALADRAITNSSGVTVILGPRDRLPGDVRLAARAGQIRGPAISRRSLRALRYACFPQRIGRIGPVQCNHEVRLAERPLVGKNQRLRQIPG